MGVTTLGEMVNSVFARVDQNPAADAAINSRSRPEIVRIIENLNMGYTQVYNLLYGSRRPQVMDAITTSPGDPSYEISSQTDVLQTLHVYPMESPRDVLEQSNMLELTQQFGVLTEQGEPRYWYRYGGTLSFYPVPNSSKVYIVEGAQKFIPLSQASDTTFMPDSHDYLLQTYAIGLEKARWRDADAALWLSKFDDDLKKLHAEALRNSPTRLYGVDLYPTLGNETLGRIIS